jgi:hypothetical protein
VTGRSEIDEVLVVMAAGVVVARSGVDEVVVGIAAAAVVVAPPVIVGRFGQFTS